MGSPLNFWFIKGYENTFEHCLDVIRETLNDSGSKEYALKGIEITAEGGSNPIHRELTSSSAGKLRGIYLGWNTDTLSPPFTPRPCISDLVQFRDYCYAAISINNPFPQASLMELTARLSHKVGPLMLMKADEETSDGYLVFEDGNVSSYGFKFTEEFILRLYGGEFKLDIYKVPPSFENVQVGEERITEAIKRAELAPFTINTQDNEMLQPFWHLSLEGLNLFYKTKLEGIGTWECNLATLAGVSDPGIGLYDIYPDGVSYSYPDKPPEEQKKPWWKVW